MKESRPGIDGEQKDEAAVARDDTPRGHDEETQDQSLDPELQECVNLIDRVRRRATGEVSQDSTENRNNAELPSTFGRFEIVKELGRGGSGIVFQAFDPELRRHVALKVPRPEYFVTDEVQGRFLREAQAAAALKHEAIVPVYEAGQAGAICYIAAEFCDGESLAHWLQHNQVPPERVAAAWVKQLAEGIDHAHQQGVLHRDLKPANVLVVARSTSSTKILGGRAAGGELTNLQPKLTDFGLAKLVDNDATATRTGALLGTPAYMAPEQAEGRLDEIDGRTDVYGLGAILYELLTGAPPFSADTELATLVAVREQEPGMPSRSRHGLSPDLEAICLMCLEKNPERRYPSAAALADDLGRYLTHQQVHARRPTPFDRLRKWSLRHVGVVWTAMVAAVLMALGLAVGASLLARSRSVALEQRAAAEEASRIAQKQTLLANHQRQVTKQNYYNATIQLAHRSWERGTIDRTIDLLDRLRPNGGDADLRGFEWHYLWGLCNTAHISRIEHDGALRAIAYSPDGRIMATAGDDKIVRIWDASSGEQVHAFSGHTQLVSDVEFAPHDAVLATASADKTVRLWNYETGELAATLEGHQHEVGGLAFSRDGMLLASACGVLRLNKANPLSRFVTGETRGEVRIWAMSTLESSLEFEAHQTSVLDVCFSPDGQTLATASADATVKLWDVKGSSATERDVLRYDSPVLAVSYSPNGRYVATGEWDGQTRLWEIGSNASAGALARHDAPVMCVRFSPDGERLATSSYDQIVRIWNVLDRTEDRRYRGHKDAVLCLAFTPDGEKVASASIDGEMKVWTLTNRQQYKVLRGMTTWDSLASYCLAFSPDSDWIAGSGRTINIWRRPFESSNPRILRGDKPHNDLVITASSDGALLASAGKYGRVDLWDTTSWQLLKTLREEGPHVWSVAMSPDSRLLAASGTGGIITLWQVESGNQFRIIDTKCDNARCVTFSPDGQQLVASCVFKSSNVERSQLRRWNVETGEELDPIGDATADWLAFSPDGKNLASGGWEKTVRLWQLEPPYECSELPGHTDVVFHGAISPDGKTLATGSWDGTIRLWQIPTGEELLVLRSPDGQLVWNVAFAPDSRTLAVGSGFPTNESPAVDISIWGEIVK